MNLHKRSQADMDHQDKVDIYILRDPARARDPFIFINKPPFYLPPLWGDNKNFIPILYLTCDLREQPAEFQIRIGLICIDNVSTAPQPRIIGYRYEKEPGNSRHNYYHTQLTLRPLEPEITLPLFSPDLPEQTPSIPVPARCIVSVFLCMLVSLYGSQYVIDIIRELDIATDIIRPLEISIFGAPVRIHRRRRSART